MFESLPSLVLEFIRLERKQWLPKERIEELQWRRLKKILKHAYDNTQFYKKKFKDAGLAPDDIKERKDLEKIPYTTREDLRKPEQLIARGFDRNKMNSSTTSGSTGRRTATYFDRRAWLLGKFLLKLRARIACGLRPLDRLAVFSERKIYNCFFNEFFLRQRFFSIFDPIEEHISEIERYNPSAMYGFPSYFSLLADRKTDGINPYRIFTSSEAFDLKTRKKIEGSFKAELFDIYGCTEVKEIAWECQEHNGYHINSDWLLVEFIKDGKAVVEEEGSIILTSLYNYGMPLIRYEVNDTGKLLERKCSCGRGLPLMAPALGRNVDYFILPDNSMISPYAMTCAIENVEGMKQYQIVQEEKSLVIVNVIPNSQFKEESKQNIRSALEQVLPGVLVHVSLVEEIAREQNGKYRIVISRVQSDK
jgi:phenylacetate-CoA ligase